MIVYANGCSFGLPIGEEKISYSRIIANDFNAQLISKHRAGSGNRRLIRTSLRDLIDLKKQTNEKILALIGLSFFFRTELWQPNLPATDNDGHFSPVFTVPPPIKSKDQYYTRNIDEVYQNTNVDVRDWYKQWVLWQNKESLLTEQLSDIIMFSSFCQQHNIEYLIWNNADLWPSKPDVDRNDIFIKSFADYALTHTKLIDPWEFAFLPWALAQGLEPIDKEYYSEYGHPGPEAHKRLANFLLTKIEELR